MLYVEPGRTAAGIVIVIERSRFTPPFLWDQGKAFAAGYRAHLQQLHRDDPDLFGDLLDQARVDDVTLTDGWGLSPHAPRLILAEFLGRLDTERRRDPALAGRVPNPSDLDPLPDAPP